MAVNIVLALTTFVARQKVEKDPISVAPPLVLLSLALSR